MTADEIIALLAEGESSRLDYKSRQYAFAGAKDAQKAELLKDILAMANAWREVDAFILIGVEEVPGKTPHVVGITEHLDDASVQQFVNSKTNRPLQFTYSSVDVYGKTVAVIRLPVQQRPCYLSQRFGPLLANVVYLRRGSSTDVADPDEIHRMGANSRVPAVPVLELSFGDIDQLKPLGQSIELHTVLLTPLSDDELPDFPRPQGIVSSAFFAHELNYGYWKEVRDYVEEVWALAGVGFVLRNSAGALASGARAELRTPSSGTFLRDDLPPRPRRHKLPYAPTELFRMHSDIEVKRRADHWHIDVTFDKVQPGATVWTTDRLYIGTDDDREILLGGHLYGDNFEPQELELRALSKPRRRAMMRADLEGVARGTGE